VTFHNYGRLENGGISNFRGNLSLTVTNLSAKSRKRSMQTAIFIVNDKYSEKIAKMTFSRQLFRIRDANGPPETGKAIGTNRKAIGKLSGDLAPVYSQNKFYWYSNRTTRMAYPALRTAKEDDNVDFQLSSASTLHISSSVQAKALERVCSDVALGSRRRTSFYATNRFRE